MAKVASAHFMLDGFLTDTEILAPIFSAKIIEGV